MQEPRAVPEVEATPHLRRQPVVRRAEEPAQDFGGQALPAFLWVRCLVPGLERPEHDGTCRACGEEILLAELQDGLGARESHVSGRAVRHPPEGEIPPLPGVRQLGSEAPRSAGCQPPRGTVCEVEARLREAMQRGRGPRRALHGLLHSRGLAAPRGEHDGDGVLPERDGPEPHGQHGVLLHGRDPPEVVRGRGLAGVVKVDKASRGVPVAPPAVEGDVPVGPDASQEEPDAPHFPDARLVVLAVAVHGMQGGHLLRLRPTPRFAVAQAEVHAVRERVGHPERDRGGGGRGWGALTCCAARARSRARARARLLGPRGGPGPASRARGQDLRPQIPGVHHQGLGRVHPEPFEVVPLDVAPEAVGLRWVHGEELVHLHKAQRVEAGPGGPIVRV